VPDLDHGSLPGCGCLDAADDDDDRDAADPLPHWPPLPARLPSVVAAVGRPAAAANPARPPPGLLDVLLPWSAVTGSSTEPGLLGRVGPVTRQQSGQLLRLAVQTGATQWRVIVTDEAGRALAVERVRLPRRSDSTGNGADSVATVGRLTMAIRLSWLDRYADTSRDVVIGGSGQAGTATFATGADMLSLGRYRLPVLRAANRAAARARAEAAARARAEAEAAAGARTTGGCTHSDASAAYRPPPRIRELVAARDVTCRFPPCGQPAWRADLDHTVPWDRGGPTCSCNLGGGCRTHHKIKALPGWHLEQIRPGVFRWTTPAGLSYEVHPDPYPV
jgi:hypothetical protein